MVVEGFEGYQLNPEQRTRLKKAVDEAIDVHYKIDGYKAVLKDIREMVKDELEVKPKDFNRVVKVIMKDTVDKFDGEHRVILDLLETVTNTSK